ncbi:hypothetical protein NXW48_10515 [Phocaeicola vulgatus]|nr:hypothetical protein [Phocaeicola vulgatus]
MCAGFQVLKDTEKSGKALALPFCKRFLRKLSASGRWTNQEDNTADFIKPILKIKKSTISVSA